MTSGLRLRRDVSPDELDEYVRALIDYERAESGTPESRFDDWRRARTALFEPVPAPREATPEPDFEALWREAKAAEAERDARTPTEAAALRFMTDAFHRLRKLGWTEAMYAPCDNSPLELIEPGSSGIHRGYRDEERRFWIVDGDTWPSKPCLFRKVADVAQPLAGDDWAERIRATPDGLTHERGRR